MTMLTAQNFLNKPPDLRSTEKVLIELREKREQIIIVIIAIVIDDDGGGGDGSGGASPSIAKEMYFRGKDEQVWL